MTTMATVWLASGIIPFHFRRMKREWI